MGLMQRWSGVKSGAVSQYGNHNIQTASVLNAVADGVTPMTAVDWQTSNPTVIHQPTTASLRDADQAERQAAEYEAAVEAGCRKLKAEGKRQSAHAKLVKAHRNYLGQTAQAHFEVASANRGLAGKLHGLRESYAQMGHSLDRKQESTDQQIDAIAMKYRGL